MTRPIPIVAAAIILAGSGVAAADDVHAAEEAFARAQKKSLEGKPGEAADLYELADQLAPSAAALRNAARARYAAGHLAMAATDAAELLRRYPDDATSRKVAEAILDDVGPSLARVEVTCDAACAVLLDGRSASRHDGSVHALFSQPGDHEVTAVFDGGGEVVRKVSLRAGQPTSLSFAPPPVEVEPAAVGAVAAPRRRDGLGRAWFLGGAVVTVGLGAVATYQGLATLDDRDQIRTLVAAGDQAGAEAAYDDARDRQRLTNLLFGATAAAGVATLVVAYFTDWSGAEAVQVTPTAGGGAVSFAGRF
ncbi:MAG TPA: hypothetical protein VM734_33225 [Kofleriaceae bacterium]|nr:hypothetical protein [Kofleriaceae bacterium]